MLGDPSADLTDTIVGLGSFRYYWVAWLSRILELRLCRTGKTNRSWSVGLTGICKKGTRFMFNRDESSISRVIAHLSLFWRESLFGGGVENTQHERSLYAAQNTSQT